MAGNAPDAEVLLNFYGESREERTREAVMFARPELILGKQGLSAPRRD